MVLIIGRYDNITWDSWSYGHSDLAVVIQHLPAKIIADIDRALFDRVAFFIDGNHQVTGHTDIDLHRVDGDDRIASVRAPA